MLIDLAFDPRSKAIWCSLFLCPNATCMGFQENKAYMCMDGLPAQEKWFSQTIHTYKPYWFDWVVIFMKHILSVMTS